MDRAERRRRRRRREQEAGGGESAATAESADAGSGESAENAQPDLPDDPSAEALEPEQTPEPEVPPQPTPAARPAAMAEVIGSAFPQTVRPNEEETETPDIDPFFQRAASRTKFTAAEPPRSAAAETPRASPEPRRPSAPQPQPEPPLPPLPDAVPRRQPPAPSRTGDPVLRALLLAALVVLAIDSYFIIRLNGVADRMSAGAAKSAVASAVTAADRPWIGIGSIKTAPFTSGGQPVTTVRFGNSGSEPAYDFRSNTVGSLRPAGSPPPDIPAQKGPVASAGVLVPNAEGVLTFFANTRALTTDEATRVRSGQLVLWLAGRLDYHDPHGKAHLTTFRYQYNPSLNSFVAAGQGNNAT
jgi:hypothetical protein